MLLVEERDNGVDDGKEDVKDLEVSCSKMEDRAITGEEIGSVVHHTFSTFKSVKTCVERYFHLSRIYSEVKDVHPIISTFKSVKTSIQ